MQYQQPRECGGCGQPFNAVRLNQRYCSATCSIRMRNKKSYQRRKARETGASVPEVRKTIEAFPKCAGCGENFTPRHHLERYCTPQCRHRSRMPAMRMPREAIACVGCSQDFTPHHQSVQYCPTCRSVPAWRRGQAVAQSRAKDPIDAQMDAIVAEMRNVEGVRFCARPTCGKEFRSTTEDFCSPQCAALGPDEIRRAERAEKSAAITRQVVDASDAQFKPVGVLTKSIDDRMTPEEREAQAKRIEQAGRESYERGVAIAERLEREPIPVGGGAVGEFAGVPLDLLARDDGSFADRVARSIALPLVEGAYTSCIQCGGPWSAREGESRVCRGCRTLALPDVSGAGTNGNGSGGHERGSDNG
jgi:hypothetical protein